MRRNLRRQRPFEQPTGSKRGVQRRNPCQYVLQKWNRQCYLSGGIMSSAVRLRTAVRKCLRGFQAYVVPELFITGDFA